MLEYFHRRRWYERAHHVRILTNAPFSTFMEHHMKLGNLKEATPQALVLAFFDAGKFLTAAPTSPVALWSVTGAGATVIPSTDTLSAVITPTSTGTVTVTVTVTGANGFSATDSATLEVISGVAVSVQIQLAPVAVVA
jgi:hypothetical protein